MQINMEDVRQEIDRSCDYEEDNLKNKIEKFWVEDEHAYGQFASDNLQKNHCFDESGNQSVNAGGVHNLEDYGRRRIVLSPGFNLQGVDYSRPLLGLTLRKTQSFVGSLEMKLATPPNPSRAAASMDININVLGSHNHQQPNLCEKLKASNFPVSKIKIGGWERVTRREGDLTAKLYYAKRKLVWEVLEGHLKSKMEILWSDITAVNAVMLHHDQPGILHIELDKPPLFFRETTPEPRKHTTWQKASDFTTAQAPLHRRHIAVFPPGVLDKHYEKLLQCDQQLLELSRKPFPTHHSPYFNATPTPIPMPPFDVSGLSVNFNGGVVGPTFLQPAYPLMNPTLTAVNFPHGTDQRTTNCQVVRQTECDERVHFPNTNLYFQEPSPSNYQLNMVTLNEIEKHLLGDTHIVCSDEAAATLLPEAQSMDSSYNPNPMNNANHSAGMGYQIIGDASRIDDQVMMMMQQSATDHHNMPLVRQTINCLPPLQGSSVNYDSIRMEANFVPPSNDYYANGDFRKKY